MPKFTRNRFLISLTILLLTLSLAVTAVGAASNKDVLFERIRTVFDVYEAWHKDGADLDTFVQGAIRGGLEALGDPHTSYYDESEFNAFMDSLNGSFSGIGAYLEQDGNYVVISSPIKGSPAFAAGLKPGDRILEANGIPLVGSTTEKAVTVIRGAEGTPITLKIERPSESRTFTVTIVRAVIAIPEVEYKLLDGGIGYLQLASFGDDAVRDFYVAVDALKAQGAKALVLDLRGNGGGYLDAATSIGSGFLPQGQPILWEVGKSSKTARNSTGLKQVNLPVAVLVDGGTASASEILAGAIQDHGIGPIVGVNTFGKGTVQQILTLSAGGGMKVTIAEYLTPKERTVDKVGLKPDYVVELPKPDAERTQPMAFTRYLSTNDIGLDVLYLQYRLADLGYDPEQTGFYGLKTQRAVQKFAEDNLMGDVQMADPNLINVLNIRVADRLKSVQQVDTQLNKAIELVKEKIK